MYKNLILILTLSAALLSCNEKQSTGKYELNPDMPEPETLEDQRSYILGTDIGRQYEMDSMHVNLDYFIQGFLRQMQNKPHLMGPEDMRKTMDSINQLVMDKMERDQELRQEEMTRLSAELVALNEGFMERNREKEGVKELESGLQYEVLKEGTGPSPTPDDEVKIKFTGYLLNDTVFDKKHAEQPLKIPVVAEGIPIGWTEAFTRMKVGSKWKLYLPPYLAFGEEGIPEIGIPPKQHVIFDMELVEIVGK